MLHSKSIRMLITAVLVLVLLSGCSLLGDENKKEIDPPPTEGVDNGDQTADPTMAEGNGDETTVTLYYKDANGYIAPVSVNVPMTVEKAKTALNLMVEGGEGEALVPAGFKAPLPKGTQILGINIMADKHAIVDFSEEFASYNAQDERDIMEAVTWTLTQFDTIDKVSFWLNGEPLKEMPVDATPIDEPLNRAMGINIEHESGVELGQATPVTLYFQGQSEDGETYMVPVTRLINRTDDLPLATVSELIEGPMSENLSSVVMPTAKVISVEKTDDLITVHFGEGLINEEEKVPSEILQAVVLSLTEQANNAKVHIKVAGSAKVWSTDEVDYTAPVLRPAHVNKIGM